MVKKTWFGLGFGFGLAFGVGFPFGFGFGFGFGLVRGATRAAVSQFNLMKWMPVSMNCAKKRVSSSRALG